jgi:bacteriocin biosynthesis cyclodehydratase domain-containing protein
MNQPTAKDDRRVAFRSHLRPVVVRGDATYLFSESGVTAVRGECIEGLAPLLNGTRGVAELLRDLPSGITPESAEKVTAQLVDAGLVAYQPASAPDCPGADAYWDAAGLDGPDAVRQVTTARVHIVAIGDVAAPGCAAALRADGLTVVDDLAAADLVIVLCDDYLAPGLREVDARCRAAGRPWLLAKPQGPALWIGPVFSPDQAGCWTCLSHRMWQHRQAEAYVQRRIGLSGVPAARPVVSAPGLAAWGRSMVALEAAKWLAGYRYEGQRAVRTMDTLTLDGRSHAFRARPQCPVCGDPDLVRRAVSAPVSFDVAAALLSASAASSSSDASASSSSGSGIATSSERALSPEAVLATYGHLVSPVTGVVREIRRDEQSPAFLNVFHAAAEAVGAGGCLDDLRARSRARHSGKGRTAVEAEAGALCEALERVSGTFQGDEPRIRATFAELGDGAVHPASWQLYHERQYAHRAAWNARNTIEQRVCEPFDEHAAIDWTPVWSVAGRRTRMLPTAALYYGVPDPARSGFFLADSNGCSAGGTLAEAVQHGVFELVERDGIAIWWYNRLRRPEVDIDAFAARDPWFATVRRAHEGLGRETWVLDLTTDLGIPTMVAVSRRTDRTPEDILFGFGAHADPVKALRHALTELNQLLPAVLSATPTGDGYRRSDPTGLTWWRTATLADHPYLVPDPATPAYGPDAYATPAPPDPAEAVAHYAATFAAAGLDLLVLDQTRPDLGLPVARVVVPGLRHFRTRFAPGRLYDVPVKLGLLAAPTEYEDLNPVPVFS